MPKAKRTLLDLAEKYQQLLEALEESGGEISPELDAELAANDDDFKAKVQGYCSIIRKAELTESMFRAEAERLTARARVLANVQANMKRRLQFIFDSLAVKNYDADTYKLTVCKSSRPKIEWLGEPAKIPRDFQRITFSLDSDEALKYYRAHGAMPEGFKVECGTYLKIK